MASPSSRYGGSDPGSGGGDGSLTKELKTVVGSDPMTDQINWLVISLQQLFGFLISLNFLLCVGVQMGGPFFS